MFFLIPKDSVGRFSNTLCDANPVLGKAFQHRAIHIADHQLSSNSTNYFGLSSSISIGEKTPEQNTDHKIKF